MRIDLRQRANNWEIWLVRDDHPDHDRLLDTIPMPTEGDALRRAQELADARHVSEIWMWNAQENARTRWQKANDSVPTWTETES